MSQDPAEQPYGQPLGGGNQPPPATPGYGQQPPGQPPYGQPTYGQPLGQQRYGVPGGGPGFGPVQPTGQSPLSEADQKMWSMFAHLGGILFGFIPALVIYLVQRDRGGFVRGQSAEALNFQINLAVCQVVSAVLWLILIGFVGTAVFSVIGIVFPILAAVAVNSGQAYRYPFILRLVS